MDDPLWWRAATSTRTGSLQCTSLGSTTPVDPRAPTSRREWETYNPGNSTHGEWKQIKISQFASGVEGARKIVLYPDGISLNNTNVKDTVIIYKSCPDGACIRYAHVRGNGSTSVTDKGLVSIQLVSSKLESLRLCDRLHPELQHVI